MAPTLHGKNGRGNTFFTERRHSERSAVGLTGSYETLPIALAEVRKKCANSILVRFRLVDGVRSGKIVPTTSLCGVTSGKIQALARRRRWHGSGSGPSQQHLREFSLLSSRGQWLVIARACRTNMNNRDRASPAHAGICSVGIVQPESAFCDIMQIRTNSHPQSFRTP